MRLLPVCSVLVACRLVAAVVPVASSPAAEAGVTGGWRSLFDGTSLTGWDGDPRLWSVRDGVIHGETTPEAHAQGNTFLIRKDLVVKDCELKVVYRCGSANNSGVQYRSRHITDGTPKNPWEVRGYQHELRNAAELPDVTGFLYDEGGTRKRICLAGERAEWVDGEKRVTGELIDAAAFARLFKVDDWNEVRIVAQGDRVRHYLNGTLTLDFTDAADLALREGIVALQLHGGVPMWVEFKEIAVRDLGDE
ncbi:MAG: DUF1080 domain-containing protein [Planctomycetota bacterium]